MGEEHDDPLESRPPGIEDFVALARSLHAEGVEYIVVGGMAVIHHGFVRATEDIDLLVRSTPENESRLRKALLTLPDQAARDLNPGDLDRYGVVRVADEIVVDLMRSACGIDYEAARGSVDVVRIRDVPIPFASADLLWRMKQTHREKDRLDRLFLEEKLRGGGREP